jgi:hypothetical protein
MCPQLGYNKTRRDFFMWLRTEYNLKHMEYFYNFLFNIFGSGLTTIGFNCRKWRVQGGR